MHIDSDLLRTMLALHGLDQPTVASILDGVRRVPTEPERAPPARRPLPRDDAESALFRERYADLGAASDQGGMSETRVVHDTELDRSLMLKMPPVDSEGPWARFDDEIRLTARLQHPGIVPVHDAGIAADGRPWFVMRRVSGATFSRGIGVAHGLLPPDETFSERWSCNRLVQTLLAICRAAAYAHRRGVVHRDIKSDNIVVDAFGSVVLLDWGVALDTTRRARDSGAGEGDFAEPGASQGDSVVGTRGFRAPEQDAGGGRVGPHSDVFALGRVLLHILAGEPPERDEIPATVADTLSGADQVDDLVEIANRATRPDVSERYPDADALSEALQHWLDGALRRRQALELVEQATEHWRSARARRSEAERQSRAAEARLDAIDPLAPDAVKEPVWELQDRAAGECIEADLQEDRVEQALQASLRLANGLVQSHEGLLGLYRQRHVEAEAARDHGRARVLEQQMRSHLQAIPRGSHAEVSARRYLANRGAVSLLTAPAGASVSAVRQIERGRRLVDGEVIELGASPLVERSLPAGSYVLAIRADDRASVRYPVLIRREAHWDGIPPGGDRSAPIALPRSEELGPDDVYVPAGPCLVGGDEQAANSLARQQVWLEGFVVERHCVTVGRYVAFLNDLHASGDSDEAWNRNPEYSEGGPTSVVGTRVFPFRDGAFHLPDPIEGWVVRPDHPVTYVDHPSASAFAAWQAKRTGKPWRLLTAYEWEKAARGVDGRSYAMGEHLEPTWALISRSRRGGRPSVRPVGQDVDDVSVYGVRGFTGNVFEWTADRFELLGRPSRGGRPPTPEEGDPTFREVRGGGWMAGAQEARAAARGGAMPETRTGYLGFRLARSWPDHHHHRGGRDG